MVGGDLHWLWKPYALYQEVDYVCILRTLKAKMTSNQHP